MVSEWWLGENKGGTAFERMPQKKWGHWSAKSGGRIIKKNGGLKAVLGWGPSEEKVFENNDSGKPRKKTEKNLKTGSVGSKGAKDTAQRRRATIVKRGLGGESQLEARITRGKRINKCRRFLKKRKREKRVEAWKAMAKGPTKREGREGAAEKKKV